MSIRDEKAHYLFSVLRGQKGDSFIVFDGMGTCYLAVISNISKGQVTAEVLETFSCDFESPLYSVLVQGILKGDKMDFVVQKTTELGISEIVPAVTERSQLRDTRRLKRWVKIAEEAARQSGRSVVPVIREPVELKDYLVSPTFPPPLQGFIFYEEEGMSLKEVYGEMNGHPLPRSLSILVGAEGGFTREEVALVEERGLRVVSLGKRVLRAETAAVSAVTLVQYLFGDMG